MSGLIIMREALLLGLTTAPFCLTFCGPTLLPFLTAQRHGTLRSGGGTLGVFLLGRLIAYVAVGFILGLLGRHIMMGEAAVALSWAMLALAAYMIYYGTLLAREDGKTGVGCLAKELAQTRRGPFLTGLLTGLSFCPPFYLAAVGAMKMGSVVGGVFFFLMFFVGTSALLAPMIFVPRLVRLLDPARLRRAASAIAYVVAFCFALQALAGLAPRPAPDFVPVPEAEPIAEKPAAALATEEAPKAARPSRYAAVTGKQLRAAFPKAARFEKANAPEPYYLALPAEGDTPRGYVFACQDFIAKDKIELTEGHGGVVPVLLGVDRQGRIVGVHMLPNDETPTHAAQVNRPKVLRRYVGLDVKAKFKPGHDVDAVTGASYTNGALADAVRLGLRGFAKEVLAGLAASRPEPKTAADAPKAEPVEASPERMPIPVTDVVLLVLLAVATYAATRLRGATGDLVFRLAVFVVFGLVLVRYFSVNDVTRLALHSYPGPRERASWWLTVGGVLVLTLLFGRVFCRLLCPFGALTELLWRVFRLRFRLPTRVDRALRHLPTLMLWGAGVYCVFTGLLPAERFEPFAATFNSLRSWVASRALLENDGLMLGLALVALGGSVLFRRFWCLYLCPAGAALRFLSRLRILKPLSAARCRTCPRERGEEIVCAGCSRLGPRNRERSHEPAAPVE